MGVRDITGRSAPQQTQITESDLKDKQPDDVSGQGAAGVVASPLQALAKPKHGSAGASGSANATQTGTRFSPVRQKRDTASSSVRRAGQTDGAGSASHATAARGTGATAATSSATPGSTGAQREEFKTFYGLSGQAEAVFDEKPRPSPLRDAQQAFEKAFPRVKRPVDLDKLYVNTYRKEENPPGSRRFEYRLVTSRSVADLIAERYSGGKDITLDDDAGSGTYHGVYSSPDALYNDEIAPDDDDLGESYPLPSSMTAGEKVGGITAQQVERFINGLAADKAKDVKAQDARYFRTPGKDGKTPLQNLAEIRGQQIQAEAELQYGDKTLTPEGKALVESIVKNPSEADLERAYPDERKRPCVYSLSVQGTARYGNNDSPNPAQTLQGPLVMRTPRHPDARPDDTAVIVLYVPGEGIREFKSERDLQTYISSSPTLRKFLPEEEQARSSETMRYVFNKFEPVPPGRNFFEHSVQQQIDKQGRDTEYRMVQAGKRGVDLEELDGIAGASSDDLRESFDADGPLKERDLRLIEQNRPDWWKRSTDSDKRKLETYQDQAERDAARLEARESEIPTVEEHTADAIRKEWGQKYPGIDPDKVEVELKFRLPSEGPNRLNPNPKPRFEIKKVTLTQYVMIGRKLAQATTADDTDIAGLIFDRLPGTSIARSFRKVEVSATIKDENGDVVQTLHASDLNALARKLDVGKSYETVVSDTYPALREPWKKAYKSQMKADFQEAEMRGDLSPGNDRIRYSWVQAVLDNPDSTTRQKVGTHTIQTEELTIDLRGPNNLSHVRDIFPVSGVLVIGAVDSYQEPSKGSPSVVVYTPNPPAGEPAVHLFDSREAISTSAKFKKPEWVKYFKARIADVDVPKTKGQGTDMTRYDAFDLHANPRVTSGYTTFLTTRALKAGDFTEGMYDSEFMRIKENADAYTVTNEEVRRAEEAKREGVGFGTVGEIRNFVSIGQNVASLPQISTRANPRKTLSHTPKGRHLVRKSEAGKRQFDIWGSATGGDSPPKGYEVRFTPRELAGLKYNKADHIYIDGANNQYIRIGNRFYRSNFQKHADGKLYRGIYRPNNALDRFDVERIDGRWVVKQKTGLRGGDGAVSRTSTEITPGQPGLSLEPTHPDQARLYNVMRGLSDQPLDRRALRENYATLASVLSAEPNRAAFRRLVDMYYAEGKLTASERDGILSRPTPYEQVTGFLDDLRRKSPDIIETLPGRLRSAIDNDGVARKAAADIVAKNKEAADNLTSLQSRLSTRTFDAETLRATYVTLADSLSAEPNRAAFRRLVDIYYAEGKLTANERDGILSRPTASGQVTQFLDDLYSKDPDIIGSLPGRLRSAIDNDGVARKAAGDIVAKNKEAADNLTSLQSRLSTRTFDAETLRATYVTLADSLSAEPNRAAFRRLVDIYYAEGKLTANERDGILSRPTASGQVTQFLDDLYSKDPGVIGALPGRLRSAIDNDGIARKAAGDIVAKNKEAADNLTSLQSRLSARTFDAQTLRATYVTLADALAAEPNRAAFRRLVDMYYAEGKLSTSEREAILSRPTSYGQVTQFLDDLYSKDPDIVGVLPARLGEVIKEEAGAQSQMA
ncbi:dermonecrotic toxin domain-containing protein [Burkholderia ubonensis]|uniref:dermonecrotic toxin domain-containing protein n=1 Tax=Burkholderia ubonensis TaxID=101571 RepID=UPI000AAC5B8A|nr:DUF6543 domain-containing protein [Burkholderia ubonensis]